ncbi:MAG: hypothetical protein H6Q70_652 [Firmicutes bacterium]|nr:hypothetical protein [Bacillota bacterium]
MVKIFFQNTSCRSKATKQLEYTQFEDGINNAKL